MRKKNSILNKPKSKNNFRASPGGLSFPWTRELTYSINNTLAIQFFFSIFVRPCCSTNSSQRLCYVMYRVDLVPIEVFTPSSFSSLQSLTLLETPSKTRSILFCLNATARKLRPEMHLNMNAARSEDLSSLSLSFAFTFTVGFFEKRGFQTSAMRIL